MYMQIERLNSELDWIERQIREETHRPVPDFRKLHGLRGKKADALRRLAALRRHEPLIA